MGRVKLEIKRIENNANRQVTFSKRRNGLIKKAYELSILCGIDIALIIFSPYGRVTHFSGRTRIEDVLCRYINLPDQEIDKAVSFPEPPYRKSIHKEYLLSTLQRLKSENDRLANPPGDVNPEIEELQQEVNRLQQRLQMAEEQIRTYEPDPLNMTSVEEIESSEKHLVNTLTLVMQRKEYLLSLSSHLSPCDPSVLQEKSLWQGMPTSFEDMERFPEGGLNHPQIFDASATLDQLRDLQSTMYVYDPLSPGTSSNADPQNRGEYHVTNQTNENIPSWPQGYTLYSLIHEQHDMVGRPDMADRYDATWAGEHSYADAPTQQ